ncbi:MAG: flippase-like domain-containing protein [Caldilineaceae bacterium]|nr:flippase-like domain-containing protein [Caldilineaceae bacterium]
MTELTHELETESTPSDGAQERADDDASTGRPSAPGLDALRLDRRRIAVLIGLGVLTVALLLALGGGRQALDALRGADWRVLALAALIHYSGFAVRGHRWQLLLRSTGHRLRYVYVTALLLAGWFVSALLPARAGDLLRIGVLRLPDGPAAPVPVADGLGSIVMERVLDILAILLLGAAFGFFVLRTRLPGWVLTAYVVAGGVLLALGAALLLAPRLLDWLRTWSGHTLWQKALDFAGQVVVSLRALAQRPAIAALALGESLYIWLCDGLLLWLVIRALGQTVPLGAAAFVALTVDIFAAVPITPGGVGQIETAYAALLALLALPAVNIAAVVLATRLISYWSFLLVSGVVTFAAGFGAVLRRPAATGPATVTD